MKRIDLLIGEAAEDSDKKTAGALRSQIASLREKLKYTKDVEAKAKIKEQIAKREVVIAKITKKNKTE